MIDRSALAPCLDDRGCLTVLAVDHRDALRVEFDADAPDSVAPEVLTKFKLDVTKALGDLASAVMLDPEYSIDQILGAGLMPEGLGSLYALEAQGYMGQAELVNELLHMPSEAVEAGASAGKLLVLYRHDQGSVTDAQDDLIRRTVDLCGEAGLPLFVEPVPYDVVDVDDRERTVLASAERISALGPDVIKMPFPSGGDDRGRWARACRSVGEAIDQPWAVLSWGAPFAGFLDQVEVACANGCSGFMAGRAIWREAIAPETRADVLATTARERMQQLVDATADATPAYTP